MSIHRALNPLPSNMFIELGQGGRIKRLENLFKNAKLEQDDLLVMYDNEFVTDVIGSRMVGTILKYKARPIQSHTSSKVSHSMRR